MNQEKTKHKFHEVLKWIADGECIEYKNGFNEWVSTLNENVLSAVACAGNSYCTIDRFRVKPKITTKTISGTFFLRCVTHGSGQDSSEVRLETYNEIKSEDFLELGGGLVRIVSDEWYNELISCKDQLDKLKF